MTLEKAKTYALKYLTYRPRSVTEVKEYLKKKKFGQDIINEVIDYLKVLSYLDDEEFCALWIKHRIQLKPMGKSRLFNELLAKGIEPSLITKVLEENISEEVEFNLAKELIEKKMLRTNDKDKLKRLLFRRGFDFTLITKVIREIFHQSNSI